MTPAFRQYLESLTERAREDLRNRSWDALRASLPYRCTDLRAREVIRANVAMLRNIRTVEGQ